MDLTVRKLNRQLTYFDRDLYAFRMPNGVVNVMRQGKRIHDSMIPVEMEDLEQLRPNPQYLFSLTHNWKLDGRSVEWGLEPIMTKLKEMDSWTREISLNDMLKRRELMEEDSRRQRMNEFRAAAADARTPFARASNDYLVRSKINVNRK